PLEHLMSMTDDRLSGSGSSLLDALRDRRSRRFGLGMGMDAGPLAYTSAGTPVPLSEEEEALLAFAACGVTGYALGDLIYAPAGGGEIMAGMLGRTTGSGDAIDTVSVIVLNPDATYVLKRPRDFHPGEIPELVELSRAGSFVELYRRSRIEIAKGRSTPPLSNFFNLTVNRWSLYDPAATYFLPVNDLTHLYINGVLEIFREENGGYVVDERAGFRPAGIRRFARSRGGHLDDDPMTEHTFTIQQLETLVTEFVTVEQGMVLQNLALMTQALGLGGFPHWAAHPYGWLQALGFRTTRMPATRYLGMGWLLRTLARLFRRVPEVTLGLGLEVAGEPVLAPFCPPHHASMEAAVRAVVELKYGASGVFRGGVRHSAWREPSRIVDAVEGPDEAAVEATIAYCTYVHQRYGRFPAYQPPLRTVLGFQVNHLDTAFYDQYYRREALGESQRRHMSRWHPGDTPARGGGTRPREGSEPGSRTAP
ncbi:MAG TPA: hypothetical protein VE173_02935, partial [Longimicrobiales bacterium]|nr:hypothetical protein [Longimicrobiales bacterium]